MTHGRLTPVQSAVLDAFFSVEREFFLSGGAALVGFHLHHRETTDLDLFTSSVDAFERARIVLPNVISRMGGSVQTKQDAPSRLEPSLLRSVCCHVCAALAGVWTLSMYT